MNWMMFTYTPLYNALWLFQKIQDDFIHHIRLDDCQVMACVGDERSIYLRRNPIKALNSFLRRIDLLVFTDKIECGHIKILKFYIR